MIQKIRFNAVALALSLFAALPVAAQNNYDKVEIKTEKLSPTTYVLFGAGGNIGLSIGDDAVFVIDDQYAPLTPKITAAIKALTDKPVKFVLNTHWHGDHTGGNENFGKAGALIVAHENVRKRLSSDQFIEYMRAKVPAAPKEALPVVTFTQDVTFHLNGDEINAVHMGDTYFNGFYPFIDLSSGGSAEGVVATADRVIALSDDKTRIIPGHGPMSNKAELKVFRDMLATISGRVSAMMKQGKKLEEIIAAKPTAEFDERWGKGFIPPAKFIEMLVGPQAKEAIK
jgi:cyclase